MMQRLIATILACAAIHGGVATAQELYTDSWGKDFGEIWNRNGLSEYISIEKTPGSKSFRRPRLLKPAYYAWLDGYDARAFASCDDYPTNFPNASFRLLYFDGIPTNNTFGTFVSRRDDMRNGGIFRYGRDKIPAVLWSGNTVDYFPPGVLGGPSYHDFTWTKEPLEEIYYTEGATVYDKTAFCFSFNQLASSEYYPMGCATVYGGSVSNAFQTMLYLNDFGRECYYNDDNIKRQFGKQCVEKCDFSHTVFEDLLLAEFGAYTEDHEAITNTSRRLFVPTLASANQALSLFSRTYRNEQPCKHLSVGVCGKGTTRYDAIGTLHGDISFDYARNKITVDEDAHATFYGVSMTTNYTETGYFTDGHDAPCATFAHVFKPTEEMSALVNTYDATGGVCKLTYDDLYLNIIHYFAETNTVTFDMYADYNEYTHIVDVRLRKHGETSKPILVWMGLFEGEETLSELPVSALASYVYDYDTLTNPNYIIPHEQYPTSEYSLAHVTYESWYLFSSFCFSTNAPAMGRDDNLRDSLTSRAHDYGFKCKRISAQAPYHHDSLMSQYRSEIDTLCDKCYQLTGRAFYQDPNLYMELNSTKVKNTMNGEQSVSAKIQIKTMNTDEIGGITLTLTDDGHLIDSWGSTGNNAATARPLVSLVFDSRTVLPPAMFADTYMGIVTEINWGFSQLILGQ